MIKRYNLILDLNGNYVKFDEIKKVILKLKRYDIEEDYEYDGANMIERNAGDYIKFDDVINLFK